VSKELDLDAILGQCQYGFAFVVDARALVAEVRALRAGRDKVLRSAYDDYFGREAGELYEEAERERDQALADRDALTKDRDSWLADMRTLRIQRDALAGQVAAIRAALAVEHEAARPEAVAAALALADAYHELRALPTEAYRNLADAAWAVETALKAYRDARGAK